MQILIDKVIRPQSVGAYLLDLGYSNSFLSTLRRQYGYIKVNGQAVNINYILNIGDILELYDGETKSNEIVPCHMALDIVYEDEYYLAINKPCGLAVLPTRNHYTDSLANGVVWYMQSKKPDFIFRATNRLDLPTSGLVLVAKSSLAQHLLSKQNYTKEYLAVVNGKVEQSRFERYDDELYKIEMPLMNDYSLKRVIVTERGKSCTTGFRVLAYNEATNQTLVLARTITGRTHQLRVHFASVGHGIIGDDTYGVAGGQMALHSYKMNFVSPFSQKTLNIIALPQVNINSKFDY